MATGSSSQTATGAAEKSPIVSAILSWIIPGLGHYYGGLSQRGLYVFLATAAWYAVMFVGIFLLFGWLMALVTPLVHIGAGVDAYL